MYIKKNEITIITFEKDIKVVGLSHKDTGIGMFELWDREDDILNNANNKKTPETMYGIWIDPHPNEDYFVGVEVTSFEKQSEIYSCFTIPAGRYIQNLFNAESIDQLIGKVTWKRNAEWAEKNNIQIDWDVAVEIYPPGLSEMKHPEMYYLCHVKGS